MLSRREYLSRSHEFCLRGQELPQSALLDEEILEIRQAAEKRNELKRYIAENLSNKALTKKHKVHSRTIERILSYETWRHIK